MNTEFTVDYFIKKFEAIPATRWTIGHFKDIDGRCALGHCLSDEIIDKMNDAGYAEEGDTVPKCLYKITEEEKSSVFKEAYELSTLFDANSRSNGSAVIIKINNGDDIRYKQPTPKQRILAALYDIKKTQKPLIEEKTKTVYVAVPTTISEQVCELIMS